MHNPIGVVSSESGSPAENGTTTQTWYTDSDAVNRSDENIDTQMIVVNASGVMNWYNITAEANGDLSVNSGGTFNIINSQLDLTGNLNCSGTINCENLNTSIIGDISVIAGGTLNMANCTVKLSGNLEVSGTINLKNSTILLNCSSNGEFYIAMTSGSEFNILDGSWITGLEDTLRIRTFYVSKDAVLFANNSNFRYIGSSLRYTGIESESNDTTFINCNLNNCTYALSFIDSTDAVVENSVFWNCSIGLNLSGAHNNFIKDCTFRDNQWGIFGEDTYGNIISNSEFLNNSNHSLALLKNSHNNTIKNSFFENNRNSSIFFDNHSKDNSIYECIIQNTTGTAIIFNRNTNNILITDCLFDNNSRNIICDNNSVGISLINSTMLNSVISDLQLTNSSELSTLNTSFDKDMVFMDKNSNLTVRWFLHVLVQNYTFAPIPDMIVYVWDNDNGSFELNAKTDNNGWVPWINCTEYYETNNSITNITPHEVQIWKSGYDISYSQIIINKSKILSFKVNRTFKLAPDLVPTELNFSDDYPHQNEIINITATIENLGTDVFNNSNINVSAFFYVDDHIIKVSANISSIPISGEITIMARWMVNVTNGTHSIRAIIDPKGNLSELNEENNSISKYIQINSIPVAKLEVNINQTYTYTDILLNASGSFNEVGDVQIYQYFYDYGDGTNSGWISNDSVSYSYSDNNDYLVRVRVRDISGQISNWSNVYNIKILNRKPIADFSVEPIIGFITTDFILNSNVSNDLDGSIIDYYWEFSEGANRTNSSELRPHVKFNDDGEHRITLTVWDDDGEQSDLLIYILTVHNLAPIAKLNVSSTSATTDQEITFDASGTYDLDDEKTLLRYLWDFGDDNFEYDLEIVKHNFTVPGNYTVILYVFDDDNATNIVFVEINITKSAPGSNGPKEGDLFWVAIMIVLILVIFVVLILIIFITQSKKLKKQLDSPSRSAAGSAGTAGGTGILSGENQAINADDFTTAGKLDFVILKKTIGKRYVKFELHRTTKSTQDFVGIIWKSAILDSSWQIKDSIQGSKAKVIDHLQLKILANTHKGWLIDYKGNGMVLSKSYPLNTPAPSTTTAGGGSGSSGSTRGGSSTTDDLGRTTTPTSAKGDDETGSPDLSEKRV